ncbi:MULTISPECIES: hypothetical protein [unclassified Nocardiopsis]|uniref:SCO6745 family protein n=1 Tax=unclassified Nocardiopsis TaxID=2649073 RepID=UPI00135AC6B2|nr:MULTISPECIES: hypothetical protein [unclassified Nocardiopsis]
MDRIWTLIDSYHTPVYFAPETETAYREAGFKGYWMGYFASRSAALGPAPADVVTAAFYNFAPARVARAIPDAWTLSSPRAALTARASVADQVLGRVLGELTHSPDTARAAEAAVAAVHACPRAGRTLFAAHAALPVPDQPHLALWWAATALREFRGDGHIAALMAAGVDGCEANVISVALGTAPQRQRDLRGWTEQEWDQARERLRERGWLTPHGTLTDLGRTERERVEATTDRLAAPALAPLGPHGTDDLTRLLEPLAERILASGVLPFPNAMALPRP